MYLIAIWHRQQQIPVPAGQSAVGAPANNMAAGQEQQAPTGLPAAAAAAAGGPSGANAGISPKELLGLVGFGGGSNGNTGQPGAAAAGPVSNTGVPMGMMMGPNMNTVTSNGNPGSGSSQGPMSLMGPGAGHVGDGGGGGGGGGNGPMSMISGLLNNLPLGIKHQINGHLNHFLFCLFEDRTPLALSGSVIVLV